MPFILLTKPNNHLSCDEKLQSFQISGSTLHCNFRWWGDESSFCGGCLTSLTSEQLRKSQTLFQQGALAQRRWCFAQCEVISSETWCSGTGDVKESDCSPLSVSKRCFRCSYAVTQKTCSPLSSCCNHGTLEKSKIARQQQRTISHWKKRKE